MFTYKQPGGEEQMKVFPKLGSFPVVKPEDNR